MIFRWRNLSNHLAWIAQLRLFGGGCPRWCWDSSVAALTPRPRTEPVEKLHYAYLIEGTSQRLLTQHWTIKGKLPLKGKLWLLIWVLSRVELQCSIGDELMGLWELGLPTPSQPASQPGAILLGHSHHEWWQSRKHSTTAWVWWYTYHCASKSTEFLILLSFIEQHWISLVHGFLWSQMKQESLVKTGSCFLETIPCCCSGNL